MDSFYPKTRKPKVNLFTPIKRPAPSVTPPIATKLFGTPTTPKESRLSRPTNPPPIKRKSQLRSRLEGSELLDDQTKPVRTSARTRLDYSTTKDAATCASVTKGNKNYEKLNRETKLRLNEILNSPKSTSKLRTPSKKSNVTLNELFKSVRPLNLNFDKKQIQERTGTSIIANDVTASSSRDEEIEYSSPFKKINSSPARTPIKSIAFSLSPKKIALQTDEKRTTSKIEDTTLAIPLDLKKTTTPPPSPNKIKSGPLKGLSSSILDLIKAKEQRAKSQTPEYKRKTDLLAIAPEVGRTVPRIFITNKKDILPYDIVIDKCFKGLKSNYTTKTITECVDLISTIVPEWVSVVTITRGNFMRFNKDKYTITQIIDAINKYRLEHQKL